MRAAKPGVSGFYASERLAKLWNEGFLYQKQLDDVA